MARLFTIVELSDLIRQDPERCVVLYKEGKLASLLADWKQNLDPDYALLDAWATASDILTFYQERIANEGYLHTATDRNSAFRMYTDEELARLFQTSPMIIRKLVEICPLVIVPDQETACGDVGIALIELLAYLGDSLSYYQDSISTENYFPTASTVKKRLHKKANIKRPIVDNALKFAKRYKLPKQTVFKMIKSGKIPGVRLGRQYRLLVIPFSLRSRIIEINGNVSRASHGETKKEILGSGAEEVTNPSPATGGADPEEKGDVRKNAPDIIQGEHSRIRRPKEFTKL